MKKYPLFLLVILSLVAFKAGDAGQTLNRVLNQHVTVDAGSVEQIMLAQYNPCDRKKKNCR